MQSQDAPFHAHVYYTPETREAAPVVVVEIRIFDIHA
jgi:aromatic ring-cleaving dioxygenase